MGDIGICAQEVAGAFALRWRKAKGKGQRANGKKARSQNSKLRTKTTMAKCERFEDLPVWQEAARLYNVVLDLLETPGVALSPGFRDQLDRAALSVSNNIAEGFERSTKAELLSFV